MELLTASRVKAWRRCAYLHYLRYVAGYAPTTDAEALRFGTLLHRGLEAWWKNLDGDPLFEALAVLESVADPFERVRAEVMLSGYHTRWIDAGLRPLAVEVEFRAPLVNPATGRPSPLYTRAGKLDVVVEDAAGRVLVVEHKSTGEDTEMGADYWTRLRLDGQVSEYLDGVKSLGFNAEGCIYDVLVKPTQRPLKATPLEARKYTKAKRDEPSRLYAGQRENDETPEEYRDRLIEVLGANPDDYFKRVEVVRLEQEKADYAFDQWATARMMREAELAKRAPRNMDNCKRPGRCPFYAHCYESAPLDSPLFKKLESPHPELVVASPKGELHGHPSPIE